MNLAEQVIIITGGANGIGRYLVEDLAVDVRKLIVIDKDKEALDRLGSQLDKVRCYVCDVTDFSAVESTITSVYRDSPHPTVLINNAGVIHSEPLVNLLSESEKTHNPENWRRTIDINLNSVFYVTSCVVKEMLESRIKGLIINMSSISANGNAGQSAYSAAKAGVNSLTITWSKELGMFGIRTAAIAPGFIDTSSTRSSMTEAHLRGWRKKTPLGRLGRLEEVSQTARFIIENDFFTGRIVELDGGLRI